MWYLYHFWSLEVSKYLLSSLDSLNFFIYFWSNFELVIYMTPNYPRLSVGVLIEVYVAFLK